MMKMNFFYRTTDDEEIHFIAHQNQRSRSIFHLKLVGKSGLLLKGMCETDYIPYPYPFIRLPVYIL